MHYVDTREVVAALAPRYVRGRTLDIGGGTSKYKTILAPLATSYEVADLYEKSADYHEDARSLSFKDAEFDSVVSFQLLEHVDDIASSIAEMYRVLKPGGHAFVTMPFLFPQHGDPSDFHRLTKEGIRYEFERAGFAITEIGSQGGLWSVVAGLLRQLYFSHYKSYGRVKRILLPRFLRTLVWLEHRGWGIHPDIYSNVYVVGRKN